MLSSSMAFGANKLSGRDSDYLLAGYNASDRAKSAADAVCDGTADNVEIQAAVDALPSAGGKIAMTGTFNIATGITTAARAVAFDGYVWGGAGTEVSPSVGLCKWVQATNNITMLTIGENATWTVAAGCNRIWFYGDGKTQTNVPVVKFVHSSDGFFQNSIIQGYVTTSGADYGLLALDINSWGCWIENNDFEVANLVGVYSETWRNWILNNHFRNLYRGIFLYNTNTTANYQEMGWIADNDFKDIQKNAIYLKAVQGITVHDNYAHNLSTSSAGTYGFVGLVGTCHDLDIHDNGFYRYSTTAETSGYGVECSTAYLTNVMIHDNDFFLATNATKVNNNPGKNVRIYNNTGYLAPGELRTYSGTLKAGADGDAIMCWQNPTANTATAVATVYMSAGGVAGSIADMGTATTVQVIEDCEDVWSNGTHGTNAVNTVYVERGTNCNAITITSGITNNDIVAYEDFVALDLSTATHVLLQFRSTVSLNAADIALILDEEAACASPDFTLDFPAITSNTTTLVCLALNSGDAAGATADATISVGLQVKVNTRAVAGTIFYIDDIRAITVGNNLFDDLDVSPASVPSIGNTTTPIYVGAKNSDDLDCIVMRSDSAATTNLAGTWTITLTGVA